MKLKIFFLSFITFSTAFLLPFIYRTYKVSALSQNFKSEPSLYYRILPSDWLVGTVLDIGPSSQFETRYGADFQDLSVGTTISLGDDIKTGIDPNSTVSLSFNSINLLINSNTRLKFTNTSPDNFLITLNRGGSFDFETQSNQQFSVNGLHLLSQFNSANGSIEINNNLITIELTQGSVTLAFNDTNYQTQIQTVSAPKKIIFNDITRAVRLRNL